MIKPYLKKYVLSGIIIFTILVISIFVYIIMPSGKPIVPQKSYAFFEILKDGDIICRLGDRRWSLYFRDVSTQDRRFSHMGIIRVNNDQVTVIHAEGTTEFEKDFVKEEALDDFIKKARAIGIYRINDVDGNQVSNMAIEYLGAPFDWQFDINNASKLYCTELLYVILKRIMPTIELNTIYVNELKQNIIPLDAISNSDYFTEIYFIGGD